MQKEAYYFSHDSNARNDEKLLAVRMKHGWEGYGIFWAIVEKLRESSDYVLSKDYNLLAYDLRVPADKIKSIVEDFRLFELTENGKGFYSERLHNSMQQKEEIVQKRRESGRIGGLKSKSKASAKQVLSKTEARKGKESKVKENKSIAGIDVFKDEELEREYSKWLSHLKDKGKLPGIYPQEQQRAKLLSMGKKKAIECINYSIENDWLSLHAPDKKEESETGINYGVM